MSFDKNGRYRNDPEIVEAVKEKYHPTPKTIFDRFNITKEEINQIIENDELSGPIDPELQKMIAEVKVEMEDNKISGNLNIDNSTDAQ